MSKELSELVGSIQKAFGVGSIHHMGDSHSMLENQIDRASTGLFELDYALSGGLVKGSQSEIFGSEGDGKTTLSLHIAGQLQKAFGYTIYMLDAEHKLNLEYAQKLGVDTDNMLLTQPQYGEQGLDIAQAVLTTGLCKIFIIDSVTALVPLAEINGDFTDVNIGAHARLMSKMCRVLTPIIVQKGIIAIYINQVREKIGIGGMSFGSNEVTTGGRALKFYCGTRIKVTSSQVKKGETVLLTERDVNLNIVKQQWGTPFRKTSLRLILGEGFDKKLDLLEYMLKSGEVAQNSSSYRFVATGEFLGSGKSNASISLWDMVFPPEPEPIVEQIEEVAEDVGQNADSESIGTDVQFNTGEGSGDISN